MRITRPKTKAAARPKRAKPKKKSAAPIRKGVSAKASNWLHARARSVRHGHQPRTVVLGLISGFLSTIVLGLWLSGHLDDAILASKEFGANRLLAVGFAVEHIDVSGARNAPISEVRQKLGVEIGELVFAVDLAAAKARIESLGWVNRASVTRLLPNRIAVVITERTPYAVWQDGSELQLISAEGKAIAKVSDTKSARLPLIVGAGADQDAKSVLAKLSVSRELSRRAKSIVRVSGRRWDIQLQGGGVLMLPSDNWISVLEELESSAVLLKIMDQPHVIIDARIDGQLAIRRQVATPIEKPNMNI